MNVIQFDLFVIWAFDRGEVDQNYPIYMDYNADNVQWCEFIFF